MVALSAYQVEEAEPMVGVVEEAVEVEEPRLDTTECTEEGQGSSSLRWARDGMNPVLDNASDRWSISL